MTSIQWLETELKKIPFVNPKEKFKKAEELHKKEIENAFNDGRRWNNSWTGETYYEELFENPNTLGR